MFKPMDNTITPVNELTFLKLVENDAPYYSKLELYHNNTLITDYSFKPQEKFQIKQSFSSINRLMDVLRELNQQIQNNHLGNFIDRIEFYNEPHPIRPQV